MLAVQVLGVIVCWPCTLAPGPWHVNVSRTGVIVCWPFTRPDHPSGPWPLARVPDHPSALVRTAEGYVVDLLVETYLLTHLLTHLLTYSGPDGRGLRGRLNGRDLLTHSLTHSLTYLLRSGRPRAT